MKRFLKVLLMILVMPIEFALGIVWLLLWLITLPFDKVWGNTIQSAAKHHLFKGE